MRIVRARDRMSDEQRVIPDFPPTPTPTRTGDEEDAAPARSVLNECDKERATKPVCGITLLLRVSNACRRGVSLPDSEDGHRTSVLLALTAVPCVDPGSVILSDHREFSTPND
ncbi:Hydrophobin [Frankliniella fusca]|uniref:Hydrophobin n=1 Tax=Frankliniella fusca TaxID=407009 RepID=A0AAE1H3F3_9NEOP|nr:Hydrophobin [Frankliniella fusca]